MVAGFEGIEVGSQSNGESEHNPIPFPQGLMAARIAGSASRLVEHPRLDVVTIPRGFHPCQQQSARYRRLVTRGPSIWG